MFEVGDKVEKAVGDYTFPGTVVSVFTTLSGNVRLVVEATGEEYKGMLHIFNESQMKKV